MLALTFVAGACGGAGETAPDVAQPDPATPDAPGDGDSDPGSEGCTVDAIYERVAGLDREARAAELARISLEEENGHFVKYTNMTAVDNEMLFDALEDAYDVEASVYVANSDPLMQRLQREFSAGMAGADLFVASVESIEQLRLFNGDMFATIESPYRDDLLPASASAEFWLGNTLDVYVASWNPTLVSAGDVPTSWKDLADPKWEGMLGMEVSDEDWFATLVGYYVEQEGMSEEDAVQVFRDMASNARTYRGHSLLAELNAGGEFAIGTSQYLHLVGRRIDAGADLEWEPPIEPIVVSPDGIAIMCNAENPAGALLHADFMLSEPGQEIFVEQGRETTNTNVLGGRLAQTDHEVILVDYDRVIGEHERWKDLYEEIIGLGTAGE